MRVAAAALVCVACGSAEPAAREPRPPPRPRPASEQVRLTLLADRTRVAAGEKITLGARFDIEPGWHIYWSNPGESGLATEAEFSAPAGYQVGAVRFPGPERFESPGDITSYGYQELAMLSAVVDVPHSLLDAERVQFSVQASWLACRDVCIPGRGRAQIELEVARGGEPTRPAHAELFARHADLVPRPMAELGAGAPTWRRDQRQVVLALEVPGAERLEYVPASPEDLRLSGQASVPVAGGMRIELAYKPSPRPVRPAGVLAVTRGGAVRYYAVNLEEPSR